MITETTGLHWRSWLLVYAVMQTRIYLTNGCGVFLRARSISTLTSLVKLLISNEMVIKMNLTEFIRKNDIRCKGGEEFSHSPEFFKMKEFERTSCVIYSVLFLEPETYKVREFDVTLTGAIKERWDKKERKIKRRFFVNRSFRQPDAMPGLEVIEDAVSAGKSIDEAVEMLKVEKERSEFFRRYDLIDAGRYWLNRDLKRCLVDDGKVVVID